MSDAAWNEKLIARYLLGELSEAEVDRLDELSVTNDEFSQHLQSVENDLIDAYVQGDMSRQMREQFQRHMLVTPRQLERMEFALSLARLTADNAARDVTGGALSWWRSLLSSFHRSFYIQIASAATAIIGLLLSTMLLIDRFRLQDSANDERSARLREKQEFNAQLAREAARRSLPVTPERSPSPESRIVVLAFKPALSGLGESKQLTLSSPSDTVQIHLEFEGDEYVSYAVELSLAMSGQQIFKKSNLKARDKGASKLIDLVLPNSLLKEAGYKIVLRGLTANGDYEDLSTYSFNVRK